MSSLAAHLSGSQPVIQAPIARSFLEECKLEAEYVPAVGELADPIEEHAEKRQTDHIVVAVPASRTLRCGLLAREVLARPCLTKART
jgi:hypothetical protein